MSADAPVATRPRLGFLGSGWIGRKRLDAVAASGRAEILAVADSDASRAAEAAGATGAAAVSDLDELLALDPDGIVIATPTALHAPQAVRALEQGVAVFCQKPLGRDADEVATVLDAARAADRLLAVDLSYRHAEAFRRAREIVRSGSIGDVFAADLVFHNAYAPSAAWAQDPELAGGGCLIDLGIHLVDMALWTLGPRRVEKVAASLVGAPLEHYAAAQLDEIQIACSWNLHAGADAIIEAAFHGSRGGVRVVNVGGSFFDFRAELLRGNSAESLVEPPDDWGGRAILDWTERLERGERFDAATAQELLAVAELLDRIGAA